MLNLMSICLIDGKLDCGQGGVDFPTSTLWIILSSEKKRKSSKSWQLVHLSSQAQILPKCRGKNKPRKIRAWLPQDRDVLCCWTCILYLFWLELRESSVDSNYFSSNFIRFLVLLSEALVSQVMIMQSGLDWLLLKYCIISVFLRYWNMLTSAIFNLQGLLELVWLE